MAAQTIEAELGYQAPDFKLIDTVPGEYKTLTDLQGAKATVVMFICNHCPYVIRIYKELIRLTSDYTDRGISFIAISSNDVVNYPADSPERMKQFATSEGFNFPYLYDETQEVAKAYKAACTPDFSVFDENLLCVYRGRIDSATAKNDDANDGKDMRKVLDAILEMNSIPSPQLPSIGCSIKWKG